MALSMVPSSNMLRRNKNSQRILKMLASHLSRKISLASKDVVKRVSRVRASRSFAIMRDERIPTGNTKNTRANGVIFLITQLASERNEVRMLTPEQQRKRRQQKTR